MFLPCRHAGQGVPMRQTRQFKGFSRMPILRNEFDWYLGDGVMWDFSVSGALGLMARTAPFVVFRMIVYAGIVLAYIVATPLGAGLGWLIGAAGSLEFRDSATAIGAFAGFGLTAAVLFLLREYILYVVKAGHIAVLVELMEGRPIPMGRAQIDHASAMVRSRFAEANTLFAMDLLIKGVLRVTMGLIQGIANFLPIPGLDTLLGIIRACCASPSASWTR
jgi:hypothetical protein